MPVPFKVKAVYEYKSEEPDDLTFPNGQIITVTEEDDEDWYTGEYTNGEGETVEGIFPRNFVERYEPVIPSRPSKGPRRSVQPESTEAEHTADPTPTSPPLQQLPAVTAEPEQPSTKSELPSRSRQKEPQPLVDSEPQVIAAPQPSRAEVKSAKQPPPVADKPSSSSFKDRIAAFNKTAAAPAPPFKPGGLSNTGFVKKAFVAPPPSRNAYVPPPREPPPQKVYRREEDPDYDPDDKVSEKSPPPPIVPLSGTSEEQGGEAKPTSLKERIALLQKQQMEQAARHSEAAKKKEKPKRPSKTRTDSNDLVEESTEAPITKADTGETIGRASIGPGIGESEDMSESQLSAEKGMAAMSPPLPSRELVSDTNDADDSGAADTEDAQETSTEEERPRPKAAKVSEPPEGVESRSLPVATKTEGSEGEDEEEEEEEEEDPEVRRRRELRERMAKMSGGMGMMGMLGGGMPQPSKPRAPKAERPPPELSQEEETARAPPVPIMALPGMSNLKSRQAEESEPEDNQNDSALPTPQGNVISKQTEDPDDYLSHQQLSRRSTEKSQGSTHDRAPPPPPPTSRPEQTASSEPRAVPPPPPPTRQDTETSIKLGASEDEEDEDEDEVTSVAGTRSVPSAPVAPARAVPPPPPGRPRSPPLPDLPRGAPPVPMSPTSPQTRAPPPPPPAHPPSRRSTLESPSKAKARDDSDDEVTEYDGDYDTDIASSAKHKDALKSHNRDSSFDEGILTDDAAKPPTSPPTRAIPPLPTAMPRDVPPPPPPQGPPKSRKSDDAPRVAPPPIPPPKAPVDDDDDEYDPYRYTAPQHGLGGTAPVRSPAEEIEEEDMYGVNPTPRAPPPPVERQAPPPPPSERPAPPLPPVERVVPSNIDQMTMSGGLPAPEPRSRQSLDIGRSPTVSRKSTEATRQSLDQSFIAGDIDLAQNSMWWVTDHNPPPVLQNRTDILWEVESSSSQKRGGKTTISKDIYVLYQDYSQSTINVTFDQAEPNYANLEQNHERPPVPPRKDQLEAAWESFGSQIAKGAEKNSGNTVGEGGAHEFILALMQPLTSALLPVGTRCYGALIYANMANASTQQTDEIRAGDIITFRNAKFAGHKGGLHQKYSMDVGKPEHVGVVIDWDGTKKKIRAWEQGREEKGKKSKVREESYRISDLKSGEVRVWRVMPRSYVNWGSS